MTRWKVIEDEWAPVPITGPTPKGQDTLHDVAILTNIDELFGHPFYQQLHRENMLSAELLRGFVQARYIPGDPKPGILYVETKDWDMEVSLQHCTREYKRTLRPRRFLR